MKLTNDQKKYARAYHAKHYTGITIEKGLREELAVTQKNLEPTFGFKPTISQTLRYLISKAGVNP